jgi:hypothetical protein
MGTKYFPSVKIYIGDSDDSEPYCIPLDFLPRVGDTVNLNRFVRGKVTRIEHFIDVHKINNQHVDIYADQI